MALLGKNLIGTASIQTDALTSKGTLVVDGASTLTGAVTMASTAAIAGTTTIGGGYGSTGSTLTDAGNISANGNLVIDGTSTLTGNVTASGSLTVGGGYGATGVTISAAGAIQANGALTVDGTSTLTGAVTCGATLAVTTNATVGGTLAVTGNTTLTGTLAANGNVTVGTNKTFTVGTGATTLGGTLAVTGATTLTGALAANGGATVGGGYGSTGCTLGAEGNIQTNGTLTVDGAGTIAGDLTVGANKVVITATTGALAGASSILSNNATAGIGYATGAGGTVAQETSKSTGVTLNKVTGTITMHAEELAAGAIVGFTLTNSAIAATDLVIVNIKSGGTAASYIVTVDSVGAGSCKISLYNATAGNLAEAVVLSFAVIKGVAA